eukprot:1056653-Alexandrium_andersonii.AAC.1
MINVHCGAGRWVVPGVAAGPGMQSRELSHGAQNGILHAFYDRGDWHGGSSVPGDGGEGRSVHVGARSACLGGVRMGCSRYKAASQYVCVRIGLRNPPTLLDIR